VPSVSLDKQQLRVHLYGRRKGKRLRTSLRTLLEDDLPRLRIDAATASQNSDPRGFFSPPVERVWLEIGFGGGEHLAAQAEAHPEVGFIGAEIFENGIASLLRHRAAANLDNIRVLDNDARAFLPLLAEASLDRVFLLYPDPWPKARHAKRRFICPKTLDDLARLMPVGAELRIATDHPIYACWCLRHAPIHPYFEWQVSSPESWRQRPLDAMATRYEKKAIREGRTPMYLTFRRT
jgi:tRNA (guanine-N7-)-methyltransferase